MNSTPAAKKDSKIVFLFLPAELNRNYDVLQLLLIQKMDKGINYAIADINRKDLKQHFDSLPGVAHSLLLQFEPASLNNTKKEIELRYKKQKAGVAFPQFFALSMQRQLHQQFNELKPYFDQVKCYHKILKPGTPTFQTTPCRFSNERPQLRFEVTRQGENYSLNSFVEIAQTVYPLPDFTRTAFFLQKENEYFQLSFKDYQTLEWLNENLFNQQGMNQENFTGKILSRLEVDYPVNRNELLEDKLVEALPTCRVMLSELNNAFLLLTPQWLYDNILVEGPWKEKQEITIKGERLVIQRNSETEQNFLRLLSSFHPNFSSQRNGYYYLSFADAQKKQWFIKTYYSLLESNVEVVGMDLLKHFRYSPHQAETTMIVQKEEGSQVDLSMNVKFGKETISMSALQKALHSGQRAIVLKDGSLGVLSDEWLEKYATVLKHGRIHDGKIQVSRFLAFGNTIDGSSAFDSKIKKDWWERWNQWQGSETPVFALPGSVTAVLRPYQQKGFEWLALLSQIGAGACLADDMGLGKTLQTICFLAWYNEQHPGKQHIIVCPTSLLYNWMDELKKFAPAMRAEIYHGSSRPELKSDAQVIITTYGTLRSDSDNLLSHSFGIAVIDESHNIKNPSAQVTKVTQQLDAGIRIALSGTPVVNNTFDLYSQLSFVLPGIFGSREFFKREYADSIDRWGDVVKMAGLKKLTAPFILRRTKEQVVSDLPAKTEAVIWCAMSAAQEELYNEVKEQVRSSLFLDIKNNGLGKSKLAVLHGLLKLRQICNHPALLPAEEHLGRLDSAKTEFLISELTNVMGKHKVLVFSQFSSMLALLAERCRNNGIDYFLFDGSTPADRRMQMVREFQENEEAPQLFFISLKAGNTGLTLTAADYVFLFDPWWNTAVEQQAVDRTHRIGQTKNVFSYKLVCKNSIEEKILELQKRKKQLAEELIVAEEDFVKSLGEEEIAFLFE